MGYEVVEVAAKTGRVERLERHRNMATTVSVLTNRWLENSLQGTLGLSRSPVGYPVPPGV